MSYRIREGAQLDATASALLDVIVAYPGEGQIPTDSNVEAEYLALAGPHPAIPLDDVLEYLIRRGSIEHIDDPEPEPEPPPDDEPGEEEVTE